MGIKNIRLFEKIDKREFFLLFSIIFIGVILRIYNLGIRDFWYDEVHSIYFLDDIKNINILKIILHPQPPFYYMLLSIWNNFGGSEFYLRLLSAILGIVSILMMYQLGKIYFDRRVGLMAAFFLSISPFHIWYSQELRPYCLIAFLAITQAYFFAKTIERHKKFWIPFCIVSILGIYTSYFFIFLVFSTGTIFFIKSYKDSVTRWLWSCWIIFIAFILYVYHYFTAIHLMKDVFWAPKITLKSFFMIFANLNMGYNCSVKFYHISLILFLILFIFGLYSFRTKKSLLFVSFFAVPLTAIFFTSQLIPVFISRNLVLIFPFYCCIIAAGVIGIKSRILKIIAFSLLVFFFSFSLKNYYSNYMPTPEYPYHIGAHRKASFKLAVKYINSNFQKGDIIAHANLGTIAPFEYYSGERDRQYFFFFPPALCLYERENINITKSERPSVIIDVREVFDKYEFKRIWLLLSSWDRDGTLDANSKIVKEYVEKYYVIESSKNMDGMLVNLYVKKNHT